MDSTTLWERIVSFSGEEFHTKTGIAYTYHIKGEQVILENTNRKIPRNDFEKALTVKNPSVAKFQEINLQGPSYIYGIITDSRIIKP